MKLLTVKLLNSFCLSSSFFENNAPVLQNAAVFNYQLTHKCGNRFGFISNQNINKTTIKRLNNRKFRCISRFPISLHLPEVFEEYLDLRCCQENYFEKSG